ncbi:TetR/AcrR family transcriptional regulator [Ruania albidiflava]|uniref:TetR/AcrR family transcriptional regulator n=1 Tax=Ruania albidiflava TaxID=366586 RepID=UPI0003B62697|nr:TetR/AcrR family transcriptional regulator [Ruania albidiflava]
MVERVETMVRIPVEQRRRQLVAAAFTVIATRGLAATSARAVVAEAGMSLASFHYAFTSREELLEMLITEVTDGEQAAVLPQELAGKTLEELLIEGLTGYLEHLRADPLREQAMLELTQYAIRSQPELAQHQYRRYREIAAAALQLAASETGTRWQVPLGTVARLLVHVTDGLTLTWLVDRDDRAARDALAAAARALTALAAPEPPTAPEPSPQE